MLNGPDTLAIVTGANGELGAAYLEEFAADPRFRAVGVSRSPSGSRIGGVEYREGVDLLDADRIADIMREIRASEAMSVALVHSVGKFAFEEFPPTGNAIDKSVLDANFTTLRNAVDAVSSAMRESARLTVCAFGSISDAYNVPYWKSYTAAKNRVRGMLRELRGNLEPAKVRASALMVNISTTETAHMHALRPNADTTYWLRPETVVERSMPWLMRDQTPAYEEINIFKPKTGFDAAAYFADHAAILERERRARNQSQYGS